MNRRSFFKVVTGFVAGIFATSGKKRSGTRPATKEEIILLQKKVYPMYKLDPNSEEWLDVKTYGGGGNCDETAAIQEAIDLAKDGGVVYFPDEIVDIIRFRGKLIVACKHSVWEIEETPHNTVMLQRKLLEYI